MFREPSWAWRQGGVNKTILRCIFADEGNNYLAQFEKTNAFVGRLKEIENMLLPGDAGLGNFLGNFFASLQAVASSPADNAPRVVAVEEGKALANSFRQTHQMLADVKAGIVLEAEQEAAL